MRPVPDILARNQLGSGLSVQVQEIEDIKNNVSLRRRCGCTSRSMSRTLTPWRASSPAANNPDGPAPIIKMSFRVIRLYREYSHIGSTLSSRSKYLSGARETLSIISAAFSRQQL